MASNASEPMTEEPRMTEAERSLPLIKVFGKVAAILGSLPDNAARMRVVKALLCLLEGTESDGKHES